MPRKLTILAILALSCAAGAEGREHGIPSRKAGWVMQSPLGSEEAHDLRLGEFTLRKKVKFSFSGRILSTANYSDEPQSSISPGDAVVSWGGEIPPEIRVTQGKRWYFFSKKPSPPPDIFSTTANLHLVGSIAQAVLKLPRGAGVEASGWLVDIEGPRGFFWKTSMSRHDRGEGACEIFLVENLKYSGGSGG